MPLPIEHASKDQLTLAYNQPDQAAKMEFRRPLKINIALSNLVLLALSVVNAAHSNS